MYRVGQEEAEAAARVVASGSMFRIQSQFKEVEQFVNELKEKMGVAHCLCLTSGTAALTTALAALGIGPGDEVIVPGYTFIATAAAVLTVGAIPVICEIDETLTMDPADLERKLSKHTKAVIPVHIAGFPCDMDAIMALSKKHGFAVVEDACQADGGSYKNRRLGSIGECGAYSFNHFKIISAGEGGALAARDMKTFERAIVFHDCGSNFWPYEQAITEPFFNGMNYRVSEVTGAILRVQLTRLDGILEDLRRNKNAIVEGCAGLPGIRFAPSNDAAGDCATTLAFQFDVADRADWFATAIGGRLLGAGGTRPINTGKHVYCNWTAVMDKRGGHSDASNPYKHPANSGLNMDFGPKSCPKTLDILSRTVYMGIGCNWDNQSIEDRIALVKNAVLS